MLPFISLTTPSLPNAGNNADPINLTALTTKTGTFDELDGYTGADWVVWTGGNYAHHKPSGNSDIVETFIGGPSGYSFGVFDDLTVDAPGESFYTTSARFINMPSGANKGVIFTVPAPRYEIRRVGCIVYAGGSGTYQVVAHLDDGSVADQTITLPNGQRTYVVCDFTPTADTNLSLTVKRANGTESVTVQWVYLAVPKSVPLPRFYKQYIRHLGVNA